MLMFPIGQFWPKLERLTLNEPVRIVHQIQVDVSQAEIIAASATRSLNLVGFMVSVPELNVKKKFGEYA